MKNSTLGRKPSNTMKSGEGAYGINPRARTTSQAGDGESFAFAGQMGDGVNRAKPSMSTANMFTLGDSADRINKGMGPRKGNQSDSSRMIKGMMKADLTIATAAQGGRIDGGATAHCPTNPDKIYMPSYVRKGVA